MKAVINGKIISTNAVLTGKAVVFDRQIRAVIDESELSSRQYGDVEIIDAGGMYVSPGLIDVHIHGYLGRDASDGDDAGLRTMAEGIVKNGVTAWLPTTMTVSMEELNAAFDSVRRAMKDNPRGAKILGVNAEGPFINAKYKGAQSEKHILPPDASFIKRNLDVIRLFTIACEIPGAIDVIKELSQTGVAISLGHTAATYEEAMNAIEAGAGHITHLFNAMTPLNHRKPGVVTAALTSPVYAEIIADCFHVSPALFDMVARLKGDKLLLITDSTRAGGLEDGEYTLGGQPIFVKGVECRLADGTIAGSVLKLNHAVRNFLDNTSLPIETVVRMASLNPAKSIGVDDKKGSIEPGKDADIIIVDERFNVKRTYISGELYYNNEESEPC